MTIFGETAAASTAAASSSAAASSAAAASAAAASAAAATATTAAATAGATAGAAAGTAAATAGTAAASSGWLSSLLVGSAASGSQAATAGLIGFGGKVTTLGLLQGGLGLFSAVSSVAAGQQQASIARSQGKWNDFQARQEKLKGLMDENAVRKAQLEDLAAQSARWGTAGIDATSGTPLALAQDTMDEASLQLGTARDDAFNREMARRIAGRQSRVEASAAAMGGVGRAAGSLMDLASRFRDRG